MADARNLTLHLKWGPDLLALLAYRAVLEEIAEGQPFDPAAQLAREVLERFDTEQEA